MGSAATLRPTCFMQHMARAPPIAAPTAVSAATFSLGAHSMWRERSFAANSVISVLGFGI